MRGLDAAQDAGLHIKINAVALRGVNDMEFDQLIRWSHGRGMDLTLIEVMPMGEIGDAARLDQYLPLSLARADDRQAVHADRDRLSHRRPGALLQGRGDRRPAGLHHAADPQFLRKLQSRAARPAPARSTCAWARRTQPIFVPRCGRRKATRSSTRRSPPRSRASPRATTSSSTAASTRPGRAAAAMSVTGG